MPEIPDSCRQCPLIAPHLRDYKVAYRNFQTDKLSRETMANEYVSAELYDAALARSKGRLEAAHQRLDSERARTVGCAGLVSLGIEEPQVSECPSFFSN